MREGNMVLETLAANLLTSRPQRWALGRAALVAFCALAATGLAAAPRDWPTVTRETKPWTRWWWMGSAVDEAGLTRALEAYRDAGIGGVEITPIYGVRGAEDRFVAYLSPQWVARLRHTLREAKRLDLGVDMATGTGWPFGGPWVGDGQASRYLLHRSFSLAAGERLGEPLRVRQEPLVRAVSGRVALDELRDPIETTPDLQRLAIDQVRFPKEAPLLALFATDAQGRSTDLTQRVRPDGTLDWTAAEASRLDAVFLGWHGKMVERAAPGGEGRVIDHFSAQALSAYLARFDRAFGADGARGVRAFFNDSYEVDDASGQADGTPAIFTEFRRRRGYDLAPHLGALFAEQRDETGLRVLADYRETLSDLLLESFTQPWRKWAEGHGAQIRNQAHGSPANILDLYAAADVPETEGRDPLRMRWATSAAHVAGRRLASAETATWLGEHFRSTLADVRTAVDDAFANGVNHVVYHGTSYAPPGERWPGWPFYAAVHFDPYNPWWADLGGLDAYVTRVQSFLQAGEPDADVLLYYPFYEALAVPGRSRLRHFGGDRREGPPSGFDDTAALLLRRGYAFDFVSDRQLRSLRVEQGRLRAPGGSYRTVLLPPCGFVPLETMETLVALARAGATVAVLGRLPDDVAGLADLDARRARYRALREGLSLRKTDARVARSAVGAGALVLSDDLEALLTAASVERETLVDRGLLYARRRLRGEPVYFLVNRGAADLDDWLPLATRARSASRFDPMSGRSGAARVRSSADGRAEVHLQLAKGESLVLATGAEASPGVAGAPEYDVAGAPQAISGTWKLRFLSGGPTLPADASLQALESWTRLADPAVAAFSGTASYSIRFQVPPGPADAWRLDLGRVAESARVRLEGREVGVLIGPLFRLTVDLPKQGELALEILVTNLAANRAADLDRRDPGWKRFYNANFPALLPEDRGSDGLFTAAGWPPLDSGLLGPVTLTPLRAR